MVNQDSNDRLFERYEELLGENYGYYIKMKTDKILGIIGRLADPKKLSFLDLGCGTGKAEEMLFDSFKKLYGLDISPVVIKQANSKKLKNCSFILGDALKTKLPSNSFDVVFSSCLLHHIPKDKHNNAIKEAKRLAKRGGMLIFFEHNPRNPVTRYMVNRCPIDTDVNLLSSNYLKNLFKGNGLADVQVEYIIFFPKFLSSLNPLERYLKRVPLGGQYAVYGKK